MIAYGICKGQYGNHHLKPNPGDTDTGKQTGPAGFLLE